MDEKAWYFTFGVGHPLRSYVQKVVATNETAARETMCRFYGTHWAFCYGPYDDAKTLNQTWNCNGGNTYTLTPFALHEGDHL